MCGQWTLPPRETHAFVGTVNQQSSRKCGNHKEITAHLHGAIVQWKCFCGKKESDTWKSRYGATWKHPIKTLVNKSVHKERDKCRKHYRHNLPNQRGAICGTQAGRLFL